MSAARWTEPHRTIQAARVGERTLSTTTLAFKGEFHAPTLNDFFPDAVLFGGTPFQLDRIMLIRLLMTVLVALFFFFALRGAKIVPRGAQNVAEIALDFVRVNIVEEIIGKKHGYRFLPLVTTIFFLVLACNLPSVIPFLNISPNARIGMPLVLAVVAYIAFIYAGSKEYGFFSFVGKSIVVPNLPLPLHFLVIPIEFLSTFVLRPLTLTIRLMANMLAGHIMLVLLFSATNFFFWQFSGWTIVSPVTFIVSIGFMLFELLVIFLQAYIFALLTAVYIELAIHADSH